jgi:hypothetical protein
MIEHVDVEQCTCERCGEKWIPRTCPKCRTTGWNTERNKGRPAKRKDIAPKVQEQELSAPPEIEEEELEPIAVQSPAKAEPKKKTPKRKAPAEGKIVTCPHGFFVIGSISACKQCAIGK